MLETAGRIARFRGLLATLTVRELQARYRGSLLGYFWSLINPLLLLAVYSAVFGWILVPRLGPGVEPYALFLVSGLFPWIWFSSSLLEGSNSLLANAGLIRKAVFPAELLPVVSVSANLVHFLLALPVAGAALVAGRLLGFPVGGWGAVALPAVVLVQLPLVAGLALGLAALTAHFKDTRDLLSNLLTLAFFATPIIYPLDAVPVAWMRSLIRANPLTPYTLAYQEVLFRGTLPEASLWLQMGAVSLLGWAAGSWLFGRLRETVVESV
ncbi:MAG TPA: ABC transporter permease [Thermoanaerobaculia bacterium]|nr:ABC transporter permease [Thermoanaerobaculia bacterium]